MHFGQNRIALLIVFLLSILWGCKNSSTSIYNSFISPEGGNYMPIGAEIPVKIQFSANNKVDSIVYSIDSKIVATKNDTTSISLKTDQLSLGNHILSAKIYADGTSDELTANFMLLAATAPTQYTYKIVNTYPHDTTAYTQGLEYQNGYFYESTGNYGYSSLRQVDVKTGKVLKQTKLDDKYFAEGMTIVGDQIVQITYRERTGFVYDKKSLKQLKQFSYTAGIEGWGLAYDGEKILNTEGSNSIIFLDKNNYHKIGSIDVYDHKGPIANLNELEIVEGKIYANIYTTNQIVIINASSGAVEGMVDLSGLLPNGYFKTDDEIGNNVLNGIAYDKSTKRLFVTGKKWPNLFEIKIIAK